MYVCMHERAETDIHIYACVHVYISTYTYIKLKTLFCINTHIRICRCIHVPSYLQIKFVHAACRYKLRFLAGPIRWRMGWPHVAGRGGPRHTRTRANFGISLARAQTLVFHFSSAVRLSDNICHSCELQFHFHLAAQCVCQGLPNLMCFFCVSNCV